MTRLPARIDTATLPDFVRHFNNRTIGFDGMLDDFFFPPKQPASNYPPYNLIRTGDDTYEIIMAVAGFSKEQVDIRITDRELTIQSLREEDGTASTAVPTHSGSKLVEGAEILHQGLAMRDFIRSFRLAEYMEVTGASMQDGILTVQLERIVPDSAKPKLIEIK